MSDYWRSAYRVIVCALLCGAGYAQTAARVPGVAPTGPPAVAGARVVPVTALPNATSALTSSTRSANQSLNLLVGRSIFITTISRLKRIYVSNPAVVDSFTSSPTQIVITAKSPGVSSLILWDEAGQSQTWLVSCNLDVASLQREIHEALPYDDISVQAQEDRVSLSGIVLSEASADTAVKLASLYAKNVVNSVVIRPVHIRQVRLKVQMIEVDRSKGAQFGLNLFSEGKNQSNVTTGQFPSTQTYTPASGSTAATLTSGNPLNLLFYNLA
jgi:pilus assembly protein CpaC